MNLIKEKQNTSINFRQPTINFNTSCSSGRDPKLASNQGNIKTEVRLTTDIMIIT